METDETRQVKRWKRGAIVDAYKEATPPPNVPFVFVGIEDFARLEAERDALQAELAIWKVCINCGQFLRAPGIRGASKRAGVQRVSSGRGRGSWLSCSTT